MKDLKEIRCTGSITDFEISEPIECVCGKMINEFSMGHGRTPYSISCPRQDCLSLHEYFPSGVGWHNNHEDAIKMFKELINIIRHVQNNSYRRPSDKKIIEYLIRDKGGWGENPK